MFHDQRLGALARMLDLRETGMDIGRSNVRHGAINPGC
jgi:hypothetical protein